MKKAPLFAITIFFIVTLAALSHAAPARITVAAIMKATGTVKTIDRDKGELTVAPEGGADMVFKLKKSQARSVREGDLVTVSYEKTGETMTARRVIKTRTKKRITVK